MFLYDGYGPGRIMIASATQTRPGSGNCRLDLLDVGQAIFQRVRLHRRSGLSGVRYAVCLEPKSRDGRAKVFKWDMSSPGDVGSHRRDWRLSIASHTANEIPADNARQLNASESCRAQETVAICADGRAFQPDTGLLHLFHHQEEEYHNDLWLRIHLLSAVWIRQMM